MAEKASADRVAADMQPPNYRAAVQRIRHAIQKIRDKIAENNAKISEEWGKVEGFKVGKKAGRIFQMLDKLDHEERTEIMRDLNGLIDAAGWDETAGDLVDTAQGNVVHLRVGGSAETGGAKDDEEPSGDDDESEMAEVEAAVAEPKPRRGRKAATGISDEERKASQEATSAVAQAARDRVAARRGMIPPVQEYTGDNSDLAD